MTPRRLLYRLCPALILLPLAALGGIGYSLMQHWGLQIIQAQGLHWHWAGLQLEHLVLEQQQPDGRRNLIELQQLNLNWTSPLRLPDLHLEHLSLHHQAARDSSETATESSLVAPYLEFERLAQFLPWLPQQVHIQNGDLNIPCASGRCQERLQLHWQQQPQGPRQLQLGLTYKTHQAQWAVRQEQDKAPVQLDLLLDGQSRLVSQHQFTPTTEGVSWSGSLALSRLPEAPWLLEWLHAWLPYDLHQLPQELRLGAGWSLTWPNTGPLKGQLHLNAHLPTAWPVPDIGPLQGTLDLALMHDENGWQPATVNADLTLQPAPALTQDWPSDLRPGHLRLKAQAKAGQEANRCLPLSASLSAEGQLRLSLQTPHLCLHLHPLALEVDQAKLELKVPRLTQAGQYQLRQLQLTALFKGQWQRDRVQLAFLPGTQLTTGPLERHDGPLKASLKKLHLALEQLTIDTALAQTHKPAERWQGKARLSVEHLQAPGLQPLDWEATSHLDTSAQGSFQLDTRLHNSAGLGLITQLIYSPKGALTLKAELPELTLAEGNPLAASLSLWPEALILNQGQIRATAEITQHPADPLQAQLHLYARQLGGQYQQGPIQGLDTELRVQQKGEEFSLHLPYLSGQQINLGLPLGPVQFSGHYRARRSQPWQGTLDWQRARLAVLGGQVQLEPSQVRLAQPRPVPVKIKGLDIAQLLALYPAPGLKGEGLLDGQLALVLSSKGIRVEQGSIAARAPGYLQLSNPGMQAMAKTNPAMELVVRALENFHYQQLSSNIRYDAEGQLQLGVRLEGQNPRLEGGRAIHFKINLEENLPTLLRSLQLAQRLSQRLQDHVQEQLQDPARPSASGD